MALYDPDHCVLILPGGAVEVELSPLNGRVEELLAAESKHTCIPHLVTAILAHCLKRIGDNSEISVDSVRDLLVVDRDYLMIKLRQITFGDKVEAIFTCPKCLSKIDIDFCLSNLHSERVNGACLEHKVELSEHAAYIDDKGVSHAVIQFRLPTGADQEVIADANSDNANDELIQLLARCVTRIGTITQTDEEFLASLSTKTRAEIAKKMTEVAPGVDREMSAKCPECSHGFVAAFDISSYFLAELRNRLKCLYQEVHTLASSYHWAEREILDMSRKKRLRYVELLQQNKQG
jgi:hypothetical protein